MSTQVLVKQMREDPKLKQFTKSLQLQESPIDFRELILELKGMMTSRVSRELTHGKLLSSKVTKAITQDTAYRSRAVEIIFSTLELKNSLSTTLENMQGYLLTRYAECLKHSYSTVADRKKFVENVTEDQQAMLDKLTSLHDHCRLLIEDIDKTAFTYSNMIKLIELGTRPERL